MRSLQQRPAPRQRRCVRSTGQSCSRRDRRPIPDRGQGERAMSAACYFPSSDQSWERREPEDAGMDPERLAAAVAYTTSHETPAPIDLRAAISAHNRSEGPSGAIIGPVKPRGGVNGLVVRHAYIVAEWGDTARVDMSFSAAKSYLSDLAGLALDRGLIRGIDDPVREYVDDGGFDQPHNSQITWRHLLQQ